MPPVYLGNLGLAMKFKRNGSSYSSFGHFFVPSPNYESLVFKAFPRLRANPWNH